jgi:hypothetical protein
MQEPAKKYMKHASSIPAAMSPDLSDECQPFSTGKNEKLVGSHRKTSDTFRSRTLLSSSINFGNFSTGTSPYGFIWVSRVSKLTFAAGCIMLRRMLPERSPEFYVESG